jgi:hypothetical protein
MFLQFLLGFRRLGYDVLFLDRVDEEMAITHSEGFHLDQNILAPYDLDKSLVVLHSAGDIPIGMQWHELVDRLRHSVLFLNFMGFVRDERVLEAAKRRVFFDLDPGFGQMWRELSLVDVLAEHDAFVTVGRNIGRPECDVPTCGLDWVTTVQPVVLEEWPPVSLARPGPFTTVGAWRGPFGPVEFNGKTYGLRVHEFRRFAALPGLRATPFEVALDIHADDARDLELLESHGWIVTDPVAATGSLGAYRSFIQRSGAEFAPAKNMYVQARAGWFSDRSACYLASGKPVLVQDTGLAKLYPIGDGLLTFTTLDEATSGVDSILGNYERHSRAARALAESIFDSDKVLTELVAKLDG